MVVREETKNPSQEDPARKQQTGTSSTSIPRLSVHYKGCVENTYCCALRIYYHNGPSPHRVKCIWMVLVIKPTVVWKHILGECHYSRMSLASHRDSVGLYSFRYSSCCSMILEILPFSLPPAFTCLPQLHPVTLPSCSMSGASWFPSPCMVLSSCFWSLAFPALCTAQISMGEQLKWPSITAKSLDTIWETKLSICSLTQRRCFVVEMVELSSTDKK